MFTRHVHLVESFAGETVIVSAEGSELARHENAVTDRRKGYAKILRIDVPVSARTIDLAIAQTGAEAHVAVDPARLRYVRVMLQDGVLSAEAIDEDAYRRAPRGYG